MRDLIVKAINETGLLGCGCCIYSEAYDGDDCPTEDGWKDHTYDGECLHNKSRAEVMADKIIAALAA
jgi:hypothetical protein